MGARSGGDTKPQPRDDDTEPMAVFSRASQLEAEAADMDPDEMAREIVRLRQLALSPEELAYLRTRKEQDEHAAWLVKFIKAHAPWVITLLTGVVSGMYWLITHDIKIGPRP